MAIQTFVSVIACSCGIRLRQTIRKTPTKEETASDPQQVRIATPT